MFSFLFLYSQAESVPKWFRNEIGAVAIWGKWMALRNTVALQSLESSTKGYRLSIFSLKFARTLFKIGIRKKEKGKKSWQIAKDLERQIYHWKRVFSWRRGHKIQLFCELLFGGRGKRSRERRLLTRQGDRHLIGWWQSRNWLTVCLCQRKGAEKGKG